MRNVSFRGPPDAEGLVFYMTGMDCGRKGNIRVYCCVQLWNQSSIIIISEAGMSLLSPVTCSWQREFVLLLVPSSTWESFVFDSQAA